MKFTVVKDPLPYLIIDSTYSIEEQLQIYKEIDFLAPNLYSPEKTASGINLAGELKKNTGVFLNELYNDRKFSYILNNNRKLFGNEVTSNLISCHNSYNLFKLTNFDSTLLSYYDDSGSYFPHADSACISAVSWFFKEPKNFYGGEFKFTDYNLNIEVKNNRTVIFFSCYTHEVSEVKIINKNVPMSGRFTLTQFYKIL